VLYLFLSMLDSAFIQQSDHRKFSAFKFEIKHKAQEEEEERHGTCQNLRLRFALDPRAQVGIPAGNFSEIPQKGIYFTNQA